jgi:hypothetical protein
MISVSLIVTVVNLSVRRWRALSQTGRFLDADTVACGQDKDSPMQVSRFSVVADQLLQSTRLDLAGAASRLEHPCRRVSGRRSRLLVQPVVPLSTDHHCN